MTTLKTITFTQDASIVNEGRVPRLYKAGETHTLRIDQANRWIKRGMAVSAAPVDEAKERMEALKKIRSAGALTPADAKPGDAAPAPTGESPRPESPKTDGIQPDVLKEEAARSGDNQQRRNAGR